MLKKGQFDWEIEHSYVTDFFKSMLPSNSELSSEIKHSGEKIYQMTHLKNTIFEIMLPLEMIRLFLEHPNYLYGNVIYDNTVRFHSSLLQMFYINYLRRDSRYMPRIDATKLYITDPLTRINIRERNLRDDYFRNKYFSKIFNIKKLLFTIFEYYFPNVTWRYIGSDMFIQRMYLQIVDLLLELGMYEKVDLTHLCKNLLEVSENLSTLELKWESDKSGLSDTVMHQARRLFFDLRFHMSRILIHIIVFINDNSLKKSIKWPKMRLNPKYKWNDSFFMNKEINSILSNILFKFIMKKRKLVDIDHDFRPLVEKISKNIDTLLMILVDLKEDIFHRSCQLIQSPSILSYYSLGSSNYYLSTATEIKENLVQLIEEIYNGEYGTIKEIKMDTSYESTLKLKKGCNYMFNWICTYVPLVGYSKQNPKAIYNKQMALNELNIVRILMDYLNFFGVEVQNFEYTAKAMRCLKNICANNLTTQASLFIGEAQIIFTNFISRSPLLGIMLCKMIFWDNVYLFSVNQPLADTILDFYSNLLETLFKQFEGDTIQKDKLDDKVVFIVALYFYNEFFIQMIDKEINLDKVDHSPLDLKLQMLIAPYINKYIFPILLKQDWVDLAVPDENGNFRTSKYQFQLLDENLGKLAELRNKKLTEDETAGLYFELCFSFCKMLNKSTNRVFFHSTYQNIKDCLYEQDEFPQSPSFQHLSTSGEGLVVRTELLKLFSSFSIFPGDSLISSRDKLVSNMEVIYFEDYFSSNSKFINDKLNQEVKLLDIVMQNFSHEDNPNVKTEDRLQRMKWLLNKLSNYILKGLFPAIYKYVSGIVSLFFVDNFKLANKMDTEKYYQQVLSICEELDKRSDILTSILGVSSCMPTSKELNPIKEIDEISIYSFEDVNIYEYSNPQLYKLRKVSNLLLSRIRSIYSTETQYLINRFTRQNGHFHQVGEIIKTDEKIFDAFEDITNHHQEEMKYIKDKEYLKLKKIIFNYVDQKNKRVILDYSNENLLMSYFKENIHITCEVYLYIMRALYRSISDLTGKIENDNIELTFTEIQMQKMMSEKKKKDSTDLQIYQFLVSESLLSYIKFMDRLISSPDKSMKMVLFYILAEPHEDNTGVFQQAEQMLNSQKELISQVKNDKAKFRESISLVYFLMMNFWHFTDFKIFYTQEWKQIWEITQQFSIFFKNMNENKAIYFKRFFSKFIPKVQLLTEFNKNNWTIFFDLYVRTESYFNNGLIYRYESRKLLMDDKPELFYSKIRYLKLMTEMLTGPCPYNQRWIYIYRSDFWIGIIFRDIDDIESPIFKLKDAVIDYLMGLMESEGYTTLDEETKNEKGAEKYLVTSQLAANVKPNQIYNTIYLLIKRLYIYRLFQTNPGYKTRFKAQIRQKEDDIIAEFSKIHKKKLDYDKRFNEAEEKHYIEQEKLEYMYQVHFDSTILGEVPSIPDELIKKVRNIYDQRQFNDFNKEESYVSLEMMKEFKGPTYKQLINMYKKDNGFSSHLILKICIKLYQMLEVFTVVSSNSKLFLETKKARITRLFGKYVDLEDRSLPDSNTQSLDPKLSERINVFFLILKVTKRIEITIGDTSMGETQLNKIIYYIVKPETMFLENETKLEIYDEIDINNKRADFQKLFKRFFVEMNLNHQSYIQNSFLYWLTKNDTLRYSKYFCWIIGLVLNLVCLYSYELSEASEENYAHRRLQTTNRGDWSITILSVILILFSAINVFLWITGRFYKEIQIEFEKYAIRNKFIDRNSTLNWIYIAIIKTLIKERSITSFFCHFIFGILGLFADKVFITFHLLLIVNINETIRYVVRASGAHINQIMLTLLLAMFFIYSYSMINANYYSDRFDNLDVGEMDVCKTLFSCFLYMLTLGFRNGGGIADSQELFDFSRGFKDTRFYIKLFFDLSFFIFVNVISLNIVFGIIIDTFGEMRAEADEKHFQIHNTCIICQNMRPTFEEKDLSFKQHINRDHDKWLYVCYIKYLISKNYIDYNGDEIDVWASYSSGRTDWMPLTKTNFLNSVNL